MDYYECFEGDLIVMCLDGIYYLDSDGIFMLVQVGVCYVKCEQIVCFISWNWGLLVFEFIGVVFVGWLDIILVDLSNFEYVDWFDFYGGGVVNILGNQIIYVMEVYVCFIINGVCLYMFVGGIWELYLDRFGVDEKYGIFMFGEVNIMIEINKVIYLWVNFEGIGDLCYSGNVGLCYVKFDCSVDGVVIFLDLVFDFLLLELL